MEVLPLTSLPVGYRFRPTDEELINHYLRCKINRNEEAVSVIREVDVCKFEPNDLPDMSVVKTNDDEWFFFCPKDRKYQNGQRLNRATKNGYWKATGKDRTIRSGRGTNTIGMKKTLVFYSGRAPKGQRTNWVIHEYRATSKELDGSKPGQGSFVLCKLIKKHDERLEGKHEDEGEEDFSSPATIKSTAEDMQSEPVTPIMSALTDKLSPGSESFLADNSDRTSLDAPLVFEGPSSVDFDAGYKSLVQPDFDLEQLLSQFCDPNPEAPDGVGNGKIFSPMHMHHMEFGSAYNLHCTAGNDMGNNHNGVQFQYGTNEHDNITDFLDSVLVEHSYEDPGSYENVAFENGPSINVITLVNDTGSCSESDAEVTHPQVVEKEAPVYTGMSLRAYRTSNIGNEEPLRHSVLLQNKMVGDPTFAISSASGQSYLSNSPDESSINSNAAGNDDIFGTGIRIRSREQHHQPTAANSGFQGTAPRRIRLQKKLQVGPVSCSNFGDLNYKAENPEAETPIVAKAEEELEQDISLSKTDNGTEVLKEDKLKMKSITYVPSRGALSWISSSMYMLRVLLVVVGLSILVVGMWKCLT